MPYGVEGDALCTKGSKPPLFLLGGDGGLRLN